MDTFNALVEEKLAAILQAGISSVCH